MLLYNSIPHIKLMNDFTLKSSKGEMFKSMLKNKDTADLLKNALNSPLGSTSRIKAKKIFSIMSKLHAHNEGFGMGGPGTAPTAPGAPVGLSQSQVPELSPRGMVMFNRIPKSNITYGHSPIAKKSQSQYLNEMSNFNVASQPPSIRKAVGSISSGMSLSGMGGPGSGFSNVWDGFIVDNRTSVGGGMGGPGYDGRGGFWSNVGTAIKDWWNTPNPNVGKTNYTSGGLSYMGGVNPNAIDISKMGGSSSSNDTPQVKYTPSFTAANPTFTLADAFKPADDESKNTQLNNPFLNVKGQNQNNKFTIDFNAKAPWDPGKPAGPSNTPPTSMTGSVDPKTGIDKYFNDPLKVKPFVAKPAPAGGTQTAIGADGKPVDKDTIIVTDGNPETNGTNVNSIFKNPGSRSDRNNNPAAFTTAVAEQAGLIEGKDYLNTGDFFIGENGQKLYTAKLIGDPIDQTIKVIDAIGFVKNDGSGNRWSYTDSIPGANNNDWSKLNRDQKAAVIAEMYAHEQPVGGGSGSGSGLSFLQQSVTQSTGPVAYGKTMTESELGGTYADLMNRNKLNVDAQYGLPAQRAAVSKMKAENLNLPKDVTAFIIARDQYIEQTDKEIEEFISTSMRNMDMSIPENAQKTNAQLNYLYTLRGRQNQSYVAYLNDAVEQHTNALNSRIESLNADTAAAKDDLANANAITENAYKLTMERYQDEYTALKNAPIEALQLQAAQAQADGATDPVKAMTDAERITHNKLIGEYMFYTGKSGVQYVKDDLDLAAKVRYALENPGEIGISPAAIIQSFKEGITNYLGATPGDPDKGDGITEASQIDKAKYAIRQWNNLADLYQGYGENIASEQVRSYANEVTEKLMSSEQVKYLKSGQMSNVIKSIQNLDTGRAWWGGSDTPPSESKFVNDFKSNTGNNTSLSDSVAKAVYATYLKYYKQSLNSNSGSISMDEAVKMLLTIMGKDANGQDTERVPVTDATMAYRLAEIVALGN